MYESYLEHVEKYWEKETTIDRIDVNWNYCKENCKWSTNKEQSQNKTNSHKITYNWETRILSEWASIVWIKRECIKERLKRGWDVDKALSKIPNRKR